VLDKADRNACFAGHVYEPCPICATLADDPGGGFENLRSTLLDPDSSVRNKGAGSIGGVVLRAHSDEKITCRLN
jgi:hypothetical protein